MVILLLRPLTYPAHRVDAGQEGGKLDRPAQRTVGALPAVQLGQCVVNLFVR